MIPTLLAFSTVASRVGASTGFTVSSALVSGLASGLTSALVSGLAVSVVGLATSVVAGVVGFTSSADTLFPPKATINIASARITPQAPNFVLRIEPKALYSLDLNINFFLLFIYKD